ncbi:MAG TPA: late competence development ComFB family protein [Anaerovoracaceae bacterium]|nr:late competence development ComFB family protein [Anaerovoracaceae bacterium]
MTEKNKTDDIAAEDQQAAHPEKLKSALVNQRHNVINVVEILANEKVSDMMARMDMCSCSKCTCDVLALALNTLPNKYVTSDAGKQYIQLESYKKQFETDVEIALMKACMIVKSAPNHDEK